MSVADSIVTGMGCLCACGNNLEISWANMMAGVGCTPCLPTKFRTTIKQQSPVFEVWPDEEKKSSISRKGSKERTRCVEYLLIALEEALKQASLTVGDLYGKSIGVCIGTTVGCTLNDEQFYRDFKKGLEPGLDAIERFLGNNPALYLGEALALRGPVSTINNACSSGLDAIGQAQEWISDGLCDIVIVGGTDELSRIPYLGFSSLLNTSLSACKPFDINRGGLNLGEGAGVLIVESKAGASKRGARALVEVAGYGTCGDAYHPTAPHPQGVGLESAIRSALAETDPGDVAFINAHGTATASNDSVEGSTLARIFGERVRVFATKAYTGHTLGAAGAIESIFAAKGLMAGKIPATAGFSEADPECVIVPTREAADVEGMYALSISLAFGGNNSAVLLKGVTDAG